MTIDTNLYGARSGIVRTDMYCHDCNRSFLAHIDFDVDGDHVVECPHCGHHHYRSIRHGKVTEARFNSDRRLHRDRAERGMWKSNTVPMETSTVSHFLRHRWLNMGSDE
jgi:DNA-directed RNA polymerase subunit RPC12/RpoP